MINHVEEMHQMIAKASGSRPEWLAKKQDVVWLQALYELIAAEICVLTDDGPKVIDGIPNERLLQFMSQSYLVFATH